MTLCSILITEFAYNDSTAINNSRAAGTWQLLPSITHSLSLALSPLQLSAAEPGRRIRWTLLSLVLACWHVVHRVPHYLPPHETRCLWQWRAAGAYTLPKPARLACAGVGGGPSAKGPSAFVTIVADNQGPAHSKLSEGGVSIAVIKPPDSRRQGGKRLSAEAPCPDLGCRGCGWSSGSKSLESHIRRADSTIQKKPKQTGGCTFSQGKQRVRASKESS